VQIGDENVHLVRCLMDEVFGRENFMALITFAKTSGSTGDYLAGTADYLLYYAKNKERVKYRQLYLDKLASNQANSAYSSIEMLDGTRRRMFGEEREFPVRIPKGARVYRLDNLQSQSIGREKGEGAASWFPVRFRGKNWLPGSRSRWKTNESGMARLIAARRLETTNNGLYYVRYIDDFPAFPLTSH
jgi:adenine-specific DNA-methyltransferase